MIAANRETFSIPWEKIETEAAAHGAHPVAGILAGVAKLISGARVRWVGVRPETRQRIYYANHTSHLDFVVLWAALPREIRALVRPVAARDYWTRSWLRRYLAAKVFNAVLVERELGAHVDDHAARSGEAIAAARAARNAMLGALQGPYSLILFPEGTRGDGTQIGKFRCGLYHLCRRRPEVELVPVYMENLNRILPKGEILPVPVMSSITFGPPLHIEEDEPKEEFLRRVRAGLCRLGGRLEGL